MRLLSWLRPARARSGRSAPSVRRPAARLGVVPLEDRTVPSTFAVLTLADSGPGSLRAAVEAANASPGADVIRFAPAARDGTVALTSGELAVTDDLRIDGPGASRLAVSGSDASRVFRIGAGVTAEIEDLTVTRGNAALRGGGIRNDGTLTLSHAVLSDNRVTGLPGVGMAVDAFGGGVFSTGTLTVRHTAFVGNRSVGGDGVPGGPGSAGLGGAIMSLGTPTVPAVTVVSHSTFADNRAVGGAAGAGSPFTRNGLGGALMNDAATTTVSHSLFTGNQAVGGAGGGATSFGSGGAIQNAALTGNATVAVSASTFLFNRAVGGATGNGTGVQAGQGGAISNFIPGFATVPVTVAATVTVTGSALVGNQAVGGTGPVGGTGRGGAIVNLNGGTLTVTDSVLALNQAIGGAGTAGDGGAGQGGGVFNGPPTPFGVPTFTTATSLVALNRATGGASAGGVAGAGVGGGLYLAPGGVASGTLTAVVANDASASDDDVFGILV
jgi:hypothetical protein